MREGCRENTRAAKTNPLAKCPGPRTVTCTTAGTARGDRQETDMSTPANTNTTVEILDQAFHRNGSSGNPFSVYLVKDEDGDVKVVVAFEGIENTAVLSVAQLAEGDIAFGSNSWRGTEYRAAVEEGK
jgi:hypothetical protein